MLTALMTGASAPATAQAKPPNVETLRARLDDLYRSKSSIARIEIQVTGPRSTRSLRLKAWTRGENESVIVIEAPPREEGAATLRVGPNLWNYLPRIARTIRVPPSMMLGSWLSPEVSLSSEWLQSPADGSGVVVPSATWTLNDRWSALLSGYLPYGREPVGLTLGSEFGAAALAAFVQIRTYR